jgi:hypothetical protein
VAIFLGVQLSVAGNFRFVTAFAPGELTGGTRALLGIWLLVQGGMRIALAFQARSARHWVRPGRRVSVM